MLTISTLVKRLTFNFARKVKSSQASPLSRPSQVSQISEQLPKTKIGKEEQLELSEEFSPLNSAINTYKQKTKSAIVKELAFEGEDPSPNKLVNRPAKGVVWGLGGQLVLADRKMQLQGIKEDPEEIAKFLELHQVKNIYIHDWKSEEDPALNRKRYSIIGSCFSARHCWKTAIELKNAFNKNVLHKKKGNSTKFDAITAMMTGRKDQEWTMVQYKDFEISLMTEEQRQAVDLQWKWNNPVSEQIVERHARMDMDKKRRKGQFLDFD